MLFTTLRYLIGILLIIVGLPVSNAGVTFRLPTQNTALFSGKNEDFYMHVDRNFEGVKSTPWEGGAYGFTRTPVKTGVGPVATKFHEGIDIKPIARDASGAPLDEIHPCAAGTVVHVSDNPRDSNYGRYVVIEHMLPDGPLYSLYAHLASTSCRAGDRVGTGNVIGILGFSGVGVNKLRSHLHLEFCLLINRDFEDWYAGQKIATPNKHGIYNGINLIGMNPADVLSACRDGGPFSLARYIATQKHQYKVRIPNTGKPDILTRYPFLLKPGPASPASWEIAFAGSGLPLAVTPSSTPCAEPVAFDAVPHPFTQSYRTGGRVSGSSKSPLLTAGGKRYIKLFSLLPGGQ